MNKSSHKTVPFCIFLITVSDARCTRERKRREKKRKKLTFLIVQREIFAVSSLRNEIEIYFAREKISSPLYLHLSVRPRESRARLFHSDIYVTIFPAIFAVHTRGCRSENYLMWAFDR